jgi:hypothetical protein
MSHDLEFPTPPSAYKADTSPAKLGREAEIVER